MRTLARILGIGGILMTLGCSDHQLSDDGSITGIWGSSQAGLSITTTAATLQILASGNCYGSYAATNQAIPNGHFELSGTFTQLTGAYPGKIDYPAQLTGTVTGSQLSISISVPALQRTIGAFNLGRGVNVSWPACAYP